MPLKIKAPSVPLRLIPEPLTPSAFAPFGTVIENPSPSSPSITHQRSPDQSLGEPNWASSASAVTANQGTALKYNDVTKLVDLYDRAPSRKPGKAVMSMFVCMPRDLLPDISSADSIGTTTAAEDDLQKGGVEGLLPIKILERHPYTTQTFIPLGLSPSDQHTGYLVVVAPTLPLSKNREARPPPFPMPEPRRRRSLREVLSLARPPPFPENEQSSVPSSRRSRRFTVRLGPPDLQNLRAFVARGPQAVTYGAGTWHAPMIVLGGKNVEFVVVQYSNGVTEEDCQEVEITTDTAGGVVVAAISKGEFQMPVKGELKAKL
ncbi:hypothetical protein FGG08_004654 [Glutinoglossum americanum]|uniref:Ureidoglycolate hydrolase n=1 Tax=Glutinoglossum americanum TaxID=1670608 RepID=A0A9P8I029_9PEZI|nr:hypothetical protein FGG08_004654 [Glutinoglossum americanum]